MIIISITHSGIISSEYIYNTIQGISSKSISKQKILLGKYLLIILYSICIYLSLFIILFILSGIKYGFKAMALPKITMEGSKIVEVNYFVWLSKNFLISLFPIIFMDTLIIFISTITLNTSFTVGFCTIISAISSKISDLLWIYNLKWLKYTPFPYINLSQHIFKTDIYKKLIGTHILELKFGILILIMSSIILYFYTNYYFLKKVNNKEGFDLKKNLIILTATLVSFASIVPFTSNVYAKSSSNTSSNNQICNSPLLNEIGTINRNNFITINGVETETFCTFESLTELGIFFIYNK